MKTRSRYLIFPAVFAFATLAAYAVPIAGQGTWERTLIARDINGDGAVDAFYDTTLDVTWMRQVYAELDWHEAVNLATQMHFGLTGWRLPRHIDTESQGCDFSYIGTDCGYNVNLATGEVAHLFHVSLGNIDYYNTTGQPQPGYGFVNTAEFVGFEGVYNIWYGQTLRYPAEWDWISEDEATASAWTFGSSIGTYGNHKDTQASWLGTMLVRDGDIGRISEPATLALGLVALAGLGLIRRKKLVGDLRVRPQYR